MRILITGGTGFIGSNLTKRLLQDGHKIIIIDNQFTSDVRNISDILTEVTYYNLDLSDSTIIDTLDGILKDIDICYHFAASIGVRLVHDKPAETLQNSFKINNNLFPLFEKHKIKVIFSSTSEIYGETTKKTGSKETDVLKILAPGKPRGSYACSKLMSEFLIKSYSFPNVIVRFFNIVGKNQVPDYGHVLPKFIEQAKAGNSLTIFGDGTQVRSYCDIRDAVEMLTLLIDDIHNDEIYNIGNDKNVYTVFELAKNVLEVLNSKSELRLITFNDAFNENFEEIYIRFPDTSKIKQYYECKYSLRDVIESLA